MRLVKLALALVGLAAVAAEADPGVTYLPAAQVAEAFARGAVLYDSPPFAVHASRRDAPGLAEIHEHETDVIYVLDGTATFVTGGVVVDGRTTAPHEIRGSGVRAGETRRLVRGDVVIVPKGIPHWFQAVPGPFTYYVVKVR